MVTRLLLIGALIASGAAACDSAEDPFIAGADTGSSDGGGDATGSDTGSSDATGSDTAGDSGGGTEDTTGTDARDAADGSPDGGDLGTDVRVDGSDTGTPDGTGEEDGVDPGDTPAPDDTGTGEFVCGEGVVYTGQIRDADVPEGGAPRFTPYDTTYEAGLAAVRAAAPSSGDPVTVDLQITQATIAATSFNNDTARRAQTNFWLADANGGVQFFLGTMDTASQPPFAVRVGQIVSVRVTSVGVYQGMAQVRTASDWTLESEGNEVFIREVGEARPLVAADAMTVVRATGTVVSLDSEECGGANKCFSLDYGAEAPVTLRTSSRFVEVGQCVTFVGPVTLFADAPQLDTVNFDWLRTYRVE